MAIQSISIPPDPSRDARAAQLAKHVGSWPKHTLKVAHGSFEAGTVFRRATGSRGERYLVNSVACECVDYAERGNICKHVRAVAIWERRQEASPLARRTAYDSLYPKCRTCPESVDRDGERCLSCLETSEREQRLAAARAKVLEAWTTEEAV